MNIIHTVLLLYFSNIYDHLNIFNIQNLIVKAQSVSTDAWYTNAQRSACGRSFGCFTDPDICEINLSVSGGSTATNVPICHSYVLYRPNPTNPSLLDFFMERRNIPNTETNNKYIALGLGHTPQMGGSSVIMCMTWGPVGNISGAVVNRYNRGYTNIRLPANEATLGISSPRIGFVTPPLSQTSGPPGVGAQQKSLSCAFSRQKDLLASTQVVFPLQNPTSRLVSGGGGMQQQPDIGIPYYLMLVEGNVDVQGEPQYHGGRPPHVSPSKIVLAQPLVSLPNGPAGGFALAPPSFGTSQAPLRRGMLSLLTRLHGIFMIVAYTMLISVATLYARHLKGYLPERKIGGLKLWFVLHRTMNYLAVVCVIIGTILIFVKARGWSYDASKYPALVPIAHSITGILAVILVLIQPVMAYFRPPGGPSIQRITFNWIHRIVGIVAFVLGIATIFLIARFKFYPVNEFAQRTIQAMIAFVVIYVLTEIILWTLHFVRHWLKRNWATKNSYDMNPYNHHFQNGGQPGGPVNGHNPSPASGPVESESTAQRWEFWKGIIINIYFIIALILMIAMVVFIALA